MKNLLRKTRDKWLKFSYWLDSFLGMPVCFPWRRKKEEVPAGEQSDGVPRESFNPIYDCDDEGLNPLRSGFILFMQIMMTSVLFGVAFAVCRYAGASWLRSIIISVIFSAVFMIYDWYVERREASDRRLMNKLLPPQSPR